MNRDVLTSPVFHALREHLQTMVILEGSSSSTKTWSIAQNLLAIALENEENDKRDLQFLILLHAGVVL